MSFGRLNSLDELPSLDEQLFTSLDVLKKYEGDVENDLCLTFTVDEEEFGGKHPEVARTCLLYTSPSPRDATLSRMPSSA